MVFAVVMRASISDKRAKLFHFWYFQPRLDLSERNQAFLRLSVATFTKELVLTISLPFPSPFPIFSFSRSRPGLHCLPKSCVHDAAAHLLGNPFFYYASVAWTG